LQVRAWTAASAGVASAAAAGHPKHHGKPKPTAVSAPQVSGNKLASALLPASAFGDGFYADGQFTTGGSLLSSSSRVSLSSMSCADFELQSDIDSDSLEFPWYNATTAVLAGTNVYLIYEVSGTTDPVNHSLLSQLISRTRALYPKSSRR